MNLWIATRPFWQYRPWIYSQRQWQQPMVWSLNMGYLNMTIYQFYLPADVPRHLHSTVFLHHLSTWDMSSLSPPVVRHSNSLFPCEGNRWQVCCQTGSGVPSGWVIPVIITHYTRYYCPLEGKEPLGKPYLILPVRLF